MDATTDSKLRETFDRLVLLLISTPREGYESEFKDITRREITRLAVPAAEQERDG
jgi:hypothetical protein